MIPVEINRHSPASPWTYRALDLRQREVAARAREGEPGALLLSELAPVVTYGRRTDLARDLGPGAAEALPVDRGGLATYHGPGQWVAFPIDRLERLVGDRRGIRRTIEGLLGAALEVALGVGATAEIRMGDELGVWSPRGKLASVGIHVEQGVLLHGLALNVYRTPESFLGIRPCGLDAQADFLLPSNDGSFESIGSRLRHALLARFWTSVLS